MPLKFIALDSDRVQQLRAGAPDANNQPAQRAVCDGDGNPCRHCLAEIGHDRPMLILAHRPFNTLQPYAEMGPIFLCAESCERHAETAGIPPLYRDRKVLIRGYDFAERIIYGTGKVIDMQAIEEEAQALFERDDLAFIHVRSPSENCYHFRIER